jgi:Tfp pilus assembly protein PilV
MAAVKMSSESSAPVTGSRRRPGETGSSLLEVLVSISLLAISGLAISMNSIMALKTLKFVELNHIASTLAISKLEEFASIDAADISPAMNETEPAVVWPDSLITFHRTSTVVVNADQSRTVTVAVSNNETPMNTSVELENTFAVWE